MLLTDVRLPALAGQGGGLVRHCQEDDLVRRLIVSNNSVISSLKYEYIY